MAAGPRLVILDQRLPDGSGLSLVENDPAEARAMRRVLVVTGHPRVDDAVAALRLGIDDYLTKPVALEVVRHAVLRSLEALELERVATLDRWRHRQSQRTSPLIGEGLEQLRQVLARIAPARAPVLLIGETGTGKSLAARTIHDLSGCRGPFVKVNCAAIPAGLIESELFGVERGAYTGATASRPGLFELADHGTLFLDEIGEVELAVQAKLLAVLEDGAARRVGGSRTIRFETRVVTATNRALAEAVDAGTFRADLYYRLDILRVEVPPLRTHPGDIAALCSLHLHRLGVPDTLAEGELARLERYAWPGNTRELFGILERAALLQTPPFEPSRFLDLAGPTPTGAPAEGPLLPLAEVEKQHILRVLDACGGHRQRSADVLGIGVATLQRRLREYAASEEVR